MFLLLQWVPRQNSGQTLHSKNLEDVDFGQVGSTESFTPAQSWWWMRREKEIYAYLTRTESSAGYFLHWHSLTKGSTIERSWVGAGPGTFLPSSPTGNIAGWPLCPGRPASIHWERKMGRGEEKKKKKGKRFLLIAYYVQATCQVLWVGHPGIKRPVGTLPGCPPVWQPWGSSSLHLLIYSSVDHRRDAENLLCKEMMNQRKNSSTYLYSTWNSRVEEENNSIWISINFQCFKCKSQGSSIVEGSAYFNSWEFHLCITWAIQQIVVFVFGEFHMPEEELRRAGLGRLGWMLGLGRVGSGSCPPQFFSNVNIMEAKKRPLKFFWK